MPCGSWQGYECKYQYSEKRTADAVCIKIKTVPQGIREQYKYSLWTLCKTLQYRKVFANAVVGEARIPLLQLWGVSNSFTYHNKVYYHKSRLVWKKPDLKKGDLITVYVNNLGKSTVYNCNEAV